MGELVPSTNNKGKLDSKHGKKRKGGERKERVGVKEKKEWR